eukprot:403358126
MSMIKLQNDTLKKQRSSLLNIIKPMKLSYEDQDSIKLSLESSPIKTKQLFQSASKPKVNRTRVSQNIKGFQLESIVEEEEIGVSMQCISQQEIQIKKAKSSIISQTADDTLMHTPSQKQRTSKSSLYTTPSRALTSNSSYESSLLNAFNKYISPTSDSFCGETNDTDKRFDNNSRAFSTTKLKDLQLNPKSLSLKKSSTVTGSSTCKASLYSRINNSLLHQSSLDECDDGRVSQSGPADFEKLFISSEENLNSYVDGIFTADAFETPNQRIKSIIRYQPPSDKQQRDESRMDIDESDCENSNEDRVFNIENMNEDNKRKKLRAKRRRQRKNLYQHNILVEEFDKNPNWDKDQIKQLSDRLGLKESQIYKWNWDHRKKSQQQVISEGQSENIKDLLLLDNSRQGEPKLNIIE